MKSVLFLLCLTSYAFAFDWRTDVRSGDSTEASHPPSSTNINKNGVTVGFKQKGN